ncbi:MAG: NAD(P)H-dependent oxidoreductase [Polyangiales bacterium]
MGKVLVVYHAPAGSTRRVACEIALALHADVEELCPTQQRSGILSYLLPTSIEKPRYDPADYDLVVLGAPMRDSVSSTVRTYLRHFGPRIFRLAVVSVGDGAGAALRLSRRIQALSGRAPVAEVAVPESDEPLPIEAVKCKRFIEAVRLTLSVSDTRVCQVG